MVIGSVLLPRPVCRFFLAGRLSIEARASRLTRNGVLLTLTFASRFGAAFS